MSDHTPPPTLLTMEEKVDRLARIVCGMLYLDPQMVVDFKTLTDIRSALVHALKLKGAERQIDAIIDSYTSESHQKQLARERYIDECMVRDKKALEAQIERKKLWKRFYIGAVSALGLALVKMEADPFIHALQTAAQYLWKVIS